MKKTILLSLSILFAVSLSACDDTEYISEESINIITSNEVNDLENNTIDQDDLGDNDTQIYLTSDWGSVSALSSTELSIEEMLIYAIQDEFTARSEYEYIIDNFEVTKPFTNIIEAEKNHIEMILPFLEDYSIDVPIDDSIDHLIIPTTLEETYAAGVEAELLNIAMYEMFLESDLPDDVVDLFTALRDASLKHLSAFERNLEKYE